MDFHSYHPETGEYLGSEPATQSPLDEPNTWLVPAHATLLPPPAPMQGKAQVFTAGAWSLIDDHRGETWWDGEGLAIEIEFLGDPTTSGLSPIEPPPPPPSAIDVIAERARRLSAGFDYDFGDGRGVHRIGTTPADMVGWDEVTKLASALAALGDTATTIPILTDSGQAEVTAIEWQQILVASAAFRQPIWMASFVLQAMEPIPADYATNEVYWSI